MEGRRAQRQGPGGCSVTKIGALGGGEPEDGIGSIHEHSGLPTRNVRGDDRGPDKARPAPPGDPDHEHRGAIVADGGRLPEELNGFIQPQEQPPLIGLAEIQQEIVSGPIPPPTMLALYRDVDPTLPGRIMAMAESEQAAAQKDRRTLVKAEAFSVRMGAIVAPLFIFSLVAVSVILYQNGQNASALAALIAAIATAVGPQIAEWRNRSATQKAARSDKK